MRARTNPDQPAQPDRCSDPALAPPWRLASTKRQVRVPHLPRSRSRSEAEVGASRKGSELARIGSERAGLRAEEESRARRTELRSNVPTWNAANSGSRIGKSVSMPIYAGWRTRAGS